MTNPKMTKVTRTSILIPKKDLVTRNAHESSNINYLEVMIIVIFKILKIQNRSIVNVKMFSTDRKILSQGIFVLNMKTLTLAVEKLLTRLKFSKNRVNSKVKTIGKKSCCHQQYSYGISKFLHSMFQGCQQG